MTTFAAKTSLIFNYLRFLLLPATLVIAAAPAGAQSVDEVLLDIENRWAIAKYESTARDMRSQLTELLKDTRVFATTHSKSPEAAAWHGIVARECTRARCRVRSRNLPTEARDALLKAAQLDPYALDGRIYANLGALYSETSSRFGGFGSHVKGTSYLWSAIVIDPDGLDSNYLYAELLVGENKLQEARDVLLKVSETPIRPDHFRADRGRQREVLTLLQTIEKRLQEKRI